MFILGKFFDTVNQDKKLKVVFSTLLHRLFDIKQMEVWVIIQSK